MPTLSHLGAALDDAREQSDSLFRLLHPEALYERSIPERHRTVFYLGHLEAFDWNLIGRYSLDLPAFHPAFDRLFAFGIDPPPGELPSDQPPDWPGLAEIERYNLRVRDEVDRALESVPGELVQVAIEHRLMHAETLAYILHNFPYDLKVALGQQQPLVSRPVQPEFVNIPAGTARLGRRPEEGFGWDNEYQAHEVEVPAFAIGRYKVTNGEYLDYVAEGAPPPFFWSDRDGRWFYRGMFSEFPLPLDWPVYVTNEEARAYARWRGKRLPTEAEFHRAAAESPSRSGNYDFRHWDPLPVNYGEPPGAQGPWEMVGNGWEWTSTPFAPFPGFEPFPFYRNYSEPFFDGRHYVLKGASPRTAACLARASFRNWFRPAYPYIYAAFRLADS